MPKPEPLSDAFITLLSWILAIDIVLAVVAWYVLFNA